MAHRCYQSSTSCRKNFQWLQDLSAGWKSKAAATLGKPKAAALSSSPGTATTPTEDRQLILPLPEAQFMARVWPNSLCAEVHWCSALILLQALFLEGVACTMQNKTFLHHVYAFSNTANCRFRFIFHGSAY
jgi:hypothetical protein